MGEKEEWLEFQRTVTEGLVPKVEGSAACISIAPASGTLDAKLAVELGVMILLGKPIFLLVPPGHAVSEKLRLVADEIVEGDLMDPADTDRIQQAIRAFSERHR